MLPGNDVYSGSMEEKEKEIIKILYDFPSAIHEAAKELSPATIAAYAYELAKEYNQFYQEIPILKEEDKAKIAFRLNLSAFTAIVIRSSLALLGISAPDRM